MSVTKLRNGEYYSSFAGRAYDSIEAARHYDERLRPAPQQEGTRLLDQLDADELGQLNREVMEEASKISGLKNYQQIQEEFVEACPEYLPVPMNGHAMQSALLGKGKITDGRCSATVQDLFEIFYDLVELGALQLRPGPAPKRPFNEQEAYTIGMDELEKRVRGW